MQLSILKSHTVAAAQDDFNASFPFLKIVFFTKTHKDGGANNAKFMITDRSKLLGDLAGFKEECLLAIEPHMKTFEVEKMVEEISGLHVQIFRKSGNTWLETTVSDHLTLDEQTEKAFSEEVYQQPIVDPLDYREQD